MRNRRPSSILAQGSAVLLLVAIVVLIGCDNAGLQPSVPTTSAPNPGSASNPGSEPRTTVYKSQSGQIIVVYRHEGEGFPSVYISHDGKLYQCDPSFPADDDAFSVQDVHTGKYPKIVFDQKVLLLDGVPVAFKRNTQVDEKGYQVVALGSDQWNFTGDEVNPHNILFANLAERPPGGIYRNPEPRKFGFTAEQIKHYERHGLRRFGRTIYTGGEVFTKDNLPDVGIEVVPLPPDRIVKGLFKQKRSNGEFLLYTTDRFSAHHNGYRFFMGKGPELKELPIIGTEWNPIGGKRTLITGAGALFDPGPPEGPEPEYLETTWRGKPVEVLNHRQYQISEPPQGGTARLVPR